MKILAGDSEKLFTPSVNKSWNLRVEFEKNILPLKSYFLEIISNECYWMKKKLAWNRKEQILVLPNFVNKT